MNRKKKKIYTLSLYRIFLFKQRVQDTIREFERSINYNVV